MKSTAKKKIKYGSVAIPDDAFSPKETKFRVTMYLDLDVLDELRKRAKERGLPYQTHINQILRDIVFGKEMDERIRRIVREELGKKAG
jgi:predicted DNA binding CopG/RHH family protein